MVWSILLTMALQLLKWMLSDDSPLKKRDEAKLREFFALADKAKARAYQRGYQD